MANLLKLLSNGVSLKAGRLEGPTVSCCSHFPGSGLQVLCFPRKLRWSTCLPCGNLLLSAFQLGDGRCRARVLVLYPEKVPGRAQDAGRPAGHLSVSICKFQDAGPHTACLSVIIQLNKSLIFDLCGCRPLQPELHEDISQHISVRRFSKCYP